MCVGPTRKRSLILVCRFQTSNTKCLAKHLNSWEELRWKYPILILILSDGENLPCGTVLRCTHSLCTQAEFMHTDMEYVNLEARAAEPKRFLEGRANILVTVRGWTATVGMFFNP